MKNWHLWVYVVSLTLGLSLGTFVVGCRNANLGNDAAEFPGIERWWR